ncbi:pentapeptide repeat-containing protein [Rhodococcus qingshengii]|uniref:Pentapeptide repeat-containing protein n=1 Tax=Rhodococcus qingshengii TaxID=334542 RepID=A0A2A5J1D9_RHOSG|nr:hypothetical protein CHR55_30665 [Rhodococcus qingshengii]
MVLTSRRLAQLPLDHKNLRGVSLNRANLSGANLRRVNLSQSDLTGAWLPVHRIDGVAIQGAILTRGCWTLNPSKPMDTLDEWQTKVRRLLRNEDRLRLN